METIEVDIAFLDHIADCIMLQKVINSKNIEQYADEQDIIDRTLKQVREITTGHRKTLKRSLAQKKKGMYGYHQGQTDIHLSEYTGSTVEKGSY